jgi:PPOX class probable F420-dependent enzyme
MSIFSSEQRKLFEGPNFVNVATISIDGTPRTTAIWVDIDGDDILLNGARSRKWISNLRNNPNIALSIFDVTMPYHQINVQGEVMEITEEGAEEHIDKLSQKYFGRDYPDHNPNDPRTIVRVKVKKFKSTGV